MLYFCIVFVLCVTVTSLYGYPEKSPIVTTKYGDIRGKLRYSRCGRIYESYTGIPYAEPPVGNLRFKAPVPFNGTWAFSFNAAKRSPICIQKNYLFANPQVQGQEDCLYLNVYVPKISENEIMEKKLLPVMVFIHWGGFIAGRSSRGYLGPDYFMDKEVILVTFNYRLGPLGFLTTLDDNASGNYGLKDQVLALKWVQDNIGCFGGNKSRVTIFGQSAGAASVHYHIISPASKGMFHQAISQSGSALAPWAKLLSAVQPNVTAAQASFVGCGDFIGNNGVLLDCLRKVPAEKIVESQDNFKILGVDPLTVYSTVAEKETELNKNPFFTKEPLDYIFAGEFQTVPWINGIVKDEGILRAGAFLRNDSLRRQLNSNFDAILPQLMALAFSTANPLNLYNDILNEYLQGRNHVNVSDPASVQGFIDLITDRAFAYPMYQSAMLHAAKGHKPIWLYSMEYKGALTYGDLFAATNETIDFNWGTCHCDDLLYLFKSPELLPKLTSQNDIFLSHVMMDLWTNFAIYGNPNPAENKKLDLTWNSIHVKDLNDMNNENMYLLNISGSHQDVVRFSITNGFYRNRMKFWSEKKLFENFDGLN